jgi:hypothetical protein
MLASSRCVRPPLFCCWRDEEGSGKFLIAGMSGFFASLKIWLGARPACPEV